MVSKSIVSFSQYRPALVTAGPHNSGLYLSYILHQIRQTSAVLYCSLVFPIFSSSGIILCTVRLSQKPVTKRPEPDTSSSKSLLWTVREPGLWQIYLTVSIQICFTTSRTKNKNQKPQFQFSLCYLPFTTRSNSLKVSNVLFEQSLSRREDTALLLSRNGAELFSRSEQIRNDIICSVR